MATRVGGKELGARMERPAKLTVHQRQDALKALADWMVPEADLA